MLNVKKNSRIATNIRSLTYWEAELSYAIDNCTEDVNYMRKCIDNIEYCISELNKFGVEREIIRKCGSLGLNWRTYFNSNEENLFKSWNIMEYSEN